MKIKKKDNFEELQNFLENIGKFWNELDLILKSKDEKTGYLVDIQEIIDLAASCLLQK